MPKIVGNTTFPSGIHSGVYNVLHYGLKGDGAASEATNPVALQALLGLIPSTGADIYFPPGDYKFSSGVVLSSSKRHVRFIGNGSVGGGASTPTRLTYTASGSGSFITAQNSAGFVLKSMMLLYNNVAFSGRVVDLRNVSGSDTAYFYVEDCVIGGALGGAVALATGLSLENAIIGAVRRCNFIACNYSIDGPTNGSNYTNAIVLSENAFHTAETVSVHNVGQGWHIVGNAFENKRNGGAGGIKNEGGAVMQGAIISANWFGDIQSGVGGTQIDAPMIGCHITGNYIAANVGSNGINVGASSSGFVITGNKFQTMDTAITLGANCVDYDVSSNGYGSVTTRISGGSALSTSATNGFAYIPKCNGVPTGTPAARTDAAPMVIDATNGKLYIYVNGAWVAMN